MKKGILKAIFFVVVLFVSFGILELAMNQGNTDMTADMTPASYPLVYMSMDGMKVNCLHGYADEMTAAYMRDTITPIGTDRKIAVQIDKYGASVSQISYEVRSADGSRLVENGTLTDYQESKDDITLSFTIKDLITENSEYNLILMVQLESGQTVRYYTRLLEQKDYHVAEKLNFVKMFHDTTFDYDKASKDIVTYLEPNESGDNSTYQTVTIHSNLKQITWGDLKISQYGDADINIKEMMRDTASFQVHFLVTTGEGKKLTYYDVMEYFRVRYTDDRIYLLDYTRTMNQIFDETASVYSGNTISLGIQNPNDIQLSECDGGGIFAFVTGNKLFSYNVSDNKLALLFSFYDKKNFDLRTLYQDHAIKILNVDETGNVQFAVYGYMNRGRHEGQVGVQISSYNSVENTVEEQVFIPYSGSADILEKSMDRLIYADNSENLYVMLDTVVYQINLTSHSYESVVSNLQEKGYEVSKSGKMLAWSSGSSTDSSKELIYMDLSSGKQTKVDAPENEYIKPLGFIEDDLVYGLAKQSDVVKDSSGRVSFLMYDVKIQDAEGKVLKDYQNNGIYVTDCTVTNDQITLHRVSKDAATGNYQAATDDQIMDSENTEQAKNSVSSAVTSEYETVTQIEIKSEIDSSNIRLLTPKEVLFEGENEVTPESKEAATPRYYVYNLYGLAAIETDAAAAVSEASDTSGVVVNDSGNYVWYKGNLVTKNQIMKITGEKQTDTKSAMAVCLDTILNFEGVSRNSQYMLDSGKTAPEILEDNIENIQVLNLKGCSLDSILYYVNQDIPVLTTLSNGNVELVIGFNDTEIVVMDPSLGTVYKVAKKDAEKQFTESDNNFITYIRTEE